MTRKPAPAASAAGAPAAAAVPYVPSIVDDVERLARDGRILTRDGEVVEPHDAADTDLVDVLTVAKRLADLAKLLEGVAKDETTRRVMLAGGEIASSAGTVRLGPPALPSLSGEASLRVLHAMLESGVVDSTTIDRVAPMAPKVSPARLRDLVAALDGRSDAASVALADQLRREMAPPRRYLKVEVA